MKEIIEVRRSDGSFSQVVVGDVLGELRTMLPDRRVIVITDANVHRRYMNLINSFEHIIIGMGETNKTLLTMDKIYHELIAMNVDRECFILGFGGGIVTDVTGFAASTYMRGLRFGFVASTLLAQVDASVGGKNGVNVEGYKNMVGTFNQPDFVLCDTSLLATLPDREFRAGMAEMIKAGVIADPALFALFEQHTMEEFRTDAALLAQAVTAAIRVKAAIVAADEREHGDRRKLNLGHTFAHAIEKSSSSFLHGEAVGIGLCMMADLAVKLGALSEAESHRIVSTVEKAGLPCDSGLDTKRLLKALRLDKKRDTESINLVVPTRIGACEIRRMTFEALDVAMA